MNTVWQLMPDERLKEWRKFRKRIEELSDSECLQEVVDWWKFTPIGSKAIDPYDNEKWPDPWALIHTGNFDENAVALGMAYTLQLMDWPCEVALVQDSEKRFLGLVVIVDNELILNYNFGTVEKLKELKHCEVLSRYKTEELI
jgi:hypothetical protein